MNETPAAADRVRAILVIVAAVGTVVFNGLAAGGYVNGVTPEVISARHPTVLTPTGYAFTIWSLIYVGIVAFGLYQMLPSNLARFRRVRTLFVLSCLFNCGWIFFWHRDAIAICLILILALLATLLLILVRLNEKASIRETLLAKAPFGLYAGWVTAASLVNTAIFLDYMGMNVSNVLGSAMIIFAAVVAFVVRIKLRNFLFPLAVAWAVTAIAVKQSGNTAIVLSAAIATIVCLVLSISFVMDLKSTSTHE